MQIAIEPGGTVCEELLCGIRCHFLLTMKRKLADDPETLILAITTGQGRCVIRKLYEHVLDARRVLCIL